MFSCVLGLSRFYVASEQFGHSELKESVGEEVSLSGLVTKEPEVRDKNTQIVVATDNDTLLVSVDRFTEVSYGDTVSVTGTLKEPQPFATDFGREFDYPGYLKARGIEYYISYGDIEVVEQGGGNPLVVFLLHQKQALIRGIESVLTEPQAGLGEGLLLGVKSALGEELEETFRVSGIIHIVVLSGYNIMLIVAFILMVFSYLLPRRTRLLVALGAIAAFALIVGLSATVVRASIMASLIVVAQLLGRSYHVTRALFFAGVVMVALNPYLLMYDIGFQLSFMATLGLIMVAPRLETVIGEKVASFGIKEFLLATVATQIAVLPILLYHIGQVSLIAIVVNVLVLPIVPVAMLTTFVAGFVALIHASIAIPFAFVAHLTLSYIINVAQACASLPFAAVTVPPISPIIVPVMYAGMGVFFWLVSKHSTQATLVDDWVIEDEDEVKQKAAGELRSPAATDTPIFFR
jgi:competence protein ComEC